MENTENIKGESSHLLQDGSHGKPNCCPEEKKEADKEEITPDNQKSSDDTGIPVDHGYAWMVVIGCFFMHMFVVGGVKSFGVLFIELEQRFEVSSKALGLVLAVATCLMLASGPVVNALSIRFTVRLVVMTGGLLSGVGYISTAFIQSFYWIYLTYGIIAGIGFGMSYAPCVVMVGHHFVKRRALANGIAVAGSGVGQFVLPNLVRFLLNVYSYQGCLLILGALSLNICVCGALMRPLSSYKKPSKSKDIQSPKEEVKDSQEYEEPVRKLSSKSKLLNKRVQQLSQEQGENMGSSKSLNIGENQKQNILVDSKLRYHSEDLFNTELSNASRVNKRKPPLRFYSVEVNDQRPSSAEFIQRRRLRHLSESELTKSETSLYASTGDLVVASLQNISETGTVAEEETGEEDLSKKSVCSRLCRLSESKSKSSVPLFDFKLLVNPVFLVFVSSVVVASFGYPNVFIMVPSYCEQLGLDNVTGAFLLSLIGISDLVGRLFFGWFSDLKFFPRKYGFLGSMAASGILSLILPFVKYYEMLVFFCCTYGFFAGSYIALIAVVLVDCLGVQKLSSAYGLTTFGMSLALFTGPLIVGGIRDATHSWDISFIFCGLMPILAACIVFLEPLAQRRLQASQSKKSEEVEMTEV